MARAELLKAAGVPEGEAEVLGLVVDHLSNAQIARRLFISIRTVESHVSSLLRNLDLTTDAGSPTWPPRLDETAHDREGTASAGGDEADEAAAFAADAACPIRYTK